MEKTTNDSVSIIVADDSSEIREVVRLMLEGEGYVVFEAEDGDSTIRILKEKKDIDLIVLDIMMPGKSGLETCEEIRSFSNVPVLFLTAKSSDDGKIAAYQSGCDSFLAKPFSKAELILRVRSHLRRYRIYKGKEEANSENQNIFIDDIEIDLVRHTITKNGENIPLTDKEFSILHFLASRRGEIFSQQQIYENVWNEKYLPASNNTIMVHILNLRKKLEEDPNNPKLICTVWGKGYRIV
ncbi:MAG: response regulator transcription factor [Clostridia bacterium]|nr:response regulator transcription factor [Clostridia bacterium]